MEAFHKLKIECPYNILNIEDIKISCRPSEHGYLYLKCLIDDSINFKYATEASTEDKIILYEELENNEKSIIFNGIIENVRTTNENGIYYLELEGASNSINLDIKEKTRSFQDSNMSYDNLVNEILKDYKIYGFTQCMSSPMSIGRPLFQYKETDWSFLKRVASLLGLELICDIINTENAFYFGRQTGKKYELKDEIDYKACKDVEAYSKAKTRDFGVDFHDTDFFYYEVKVHEKLEIGDIINFKQKNLYVNQFEAKLHKGELIYKYRFCRNDGIWIDKIYNYKIRGVSLEGTVLETAGEKLKIHLNIDESQDPSTAEWFYYTPPTGNVLYSMPLVGENAMLYFQDEIKAAPIATNCVRENGDTCDSFSDTNNRYLATETGDYLDMLPGAINFHRSGFNVNLNDENGVTLSSSGNLSVSGGSVSISGGSVSINASSKIKVQKGESSYISLENEFYSQANATYENGSDRQSYGPFTDDEPTAGVAEALAKELEERMKLVDLNSVVLAMCGSKANTKKANVSNFSEFWDELKKSNPPKNNVKKLDTKEAGYLYGDIERDNSMGTTSSTFYGKVEGPSATIGGRDFKIEHDIGSNKTENINKGKEVEFKLGQFETGINKLEFDNGWVINSVKGEAEAVAGKEGFDIGANVALVECETPKAKIPIPFTNLNLEVGLKGDLGSLGAKAKLGFGKGVSFGLHFGVGGEIDLDVKKK